MRSAVKTGPTIVGVIRYNRKKPLQQQMTFEDLSVPRAGVDAARRVLPLLPGTDTDNRLILDFIDNIMEARRVVRDIRFDPRGALNHTMAYLIMGFGQERGFTVSEDLRPVAIRKANPFARARSRRHAGFGLGAAA